MNKKKIIIIGIILVVLSLLVFVVFRFTNISIYLEETLFRERDFKELPYIHEHYQLESGYVISNYEDYNDKIINPILDNDPNYDKNKFLTEKDFEKHNYLVVEAETDYCNGDTIPLSYKFKGNELYVKFALHSSCGPCALVSNYYLLEVDKSISFANVKIDYTTTHFGNCDPNVAYKPIIYLYPEKETDVKVKLLNNKLLSVSYPKYNNLWEVKAYPDGTLIDKNNKEYYALYWEGINHYSYVHDDGFVIKGEDTAKFLDEKLEILGLNSKERNEFIIYWLDKLQNNKYNYIRFETMDEINSYMPIEVTPNPDSIIRVYMDYKPLDKYIEVKEQELFTPRRDGFSVVEWGGSLIK